MKNSIVIRDQINNFNKTIEVSGDKSISIRWVLFSSIANGVSRAKNLLNSEDVHAALKAIKTLGIKYKLKKNMCEIYGKGIEGYKYKKNLTINAENSGTLGRLLIGLLINTTEPIKLIGDKSLSKRDFRRISNPLSKFGAKFKLNNNKHLPLTIFGNPSLKGVHYEEKKGSAQCKSSVIFGAMRAKGYTFVKAKKSRNHTELLCKYLSLPITIQQKNKHDEIRIGEVKNLKPLNYNIPGDLSSAAFFVALTVLANDSQLTINKVNINPSRIGIITILKKMGIKITYKNLRFYRGERIADLKVKSPKIIKSINCPTKLNSSAIDEFLIIFIIAAKANGISYFRNLSELNQKESPRLSWGKYILNAMGIKTVTTKDSIKIYGNPDLKIDKKIVIKNYLKDHRVFMTSVIAALSFGGKWIIHDKDSIKTSFPNFLNILDQIKNLNNEKKKKYT